MLVNRKDDLAATMRRVRWAQGIAFGVIAIALVATAAQSLLGVRRAADLLTMGQGRRLLDAVRRAHAALGPDFAGEAERLVETNADFGLLCVAIVGRDHVRRAGSCAESPDEMRALVARVRPDEAVRLDGRVAMVDAPPRPRPGLRSRPPPGPEGGGPGRPPFGPEGRRSGLPPPPGPRRPPPPIVIEFAPLEAQALQETAERGAAVALIAVLVLVLAAFALWRLSRRAEKLQAEVERDRRLATLGEMASVLAHEIRNPLAGLKGHAQLLAEKLPEGGGERRSAERVVGSAIRLEKLTHDLLSFVRSPRVEPREVSPAALVRDAIEQVDGAAFDADVSGAPERWRLDPDRMQQVLANLLRNAAEASPPGRRAEVGVAVRESRLVFRVRDFGDGVAPGEEERIFEPFHTGRVQGTGLGLAVARRIVELHGGTVTVRTPDGGGAEFEVVIP